MKAKDLLEKFIFQAISGDLKTSEYPKDWDNFKLKVSFGMGTPANVPWVAFTTSEMSVSNGFYPVYLFYKDINVLILAYGISETNEYKETWPSEIINNAETIESYLDENVSRYGDSFVFKAYKVNKKDKIEFINKESGKVASDKDLESHLEQILNYYQQITLSESSSPNSIINQGIFYMEKQLEDFIIQNWNNTELGEKYDLIIENGVLKSQQYKTGIGPIDILVKDKKTSSYVVIELKKSQTSDDTIGQIARYMGWIQKEKKDNNVKGIIIAKDYDKKLDYALTRVKDIDVYIYEVDFKLKEYR